MSSLRLCLLAGTVGLAVSGCAGTRISEPQMVQQPQERISAAPSGRVDSSALPPVEDAERDQAAREEEEEEEEGGIDMASVQTQSGGGEVTEQSLLGGWDVSSSGSSCQMFLTMTSWTGGYRASTRGCSSGDLVDVNAWSYDGGQVVLKDGQGGELTRLTPRSSSSMSGGGISASRG